MTAPLGNQAWRQRGKTALQRFAEKCVFDYATGCVLWTGATTAGRGNSTRYGSFWDDGRRHFAHRWAAVHIHGIDLGTNEAGHCCPVRPNSLCVQHLEGQTKTENIIERNVRVAKANQAAETRQFYLFKQLGIYAPEPEEPVLIPALEIPFYDPPAWFRPYILTVERDDDDCPF